MVLLSLFFGCGDDAAPIDGGDDVATTDATRDVAEDVEADMSEPDAEADASIDMAAMDAGPESVGMFVAIGWGGRRILSCDEGRTWIADTFESTEDDWHQPYSPKALTYADGTFVYLTGWGNPSTVHFSRDGFDWTSTTLEGPTGGSIGYDATNERWVMQTGRTLFASTDLVEFTAIEGLEGPMLNRDGAVYDGIYVAGTDGVVRVLPDGATEWTDITSCEGARHGSIGVSGGFARGGDRIVSFGDEGSSCVASTSGEDLGAGDMGTERIRGYGAYVGDEFWATNDAQIFRSEDGLSWTSSDFPDGVRFHLVAQSDSGTIVGIDRNGDAFYYSTDGGESWERADAPEGNNLFRLSFGRVAPSAMCPAD